MQENELVCKSLGVPSLVNSMREATAAVKNRKRKGKDPEGCDEYSPEIEGEDGSDDSSEVCKSNLFTTFCPRFIHIKKIKLKS